MNFGDRHIAGAILAATLASGPQFATARASQAAQPSSTLPADITLQQYVAMTSAECGIFLTRYLTAVIATITAKDRALGKQVNDYFFIPPPGEKAAPGMRVLMARISDIQLMADAGKADLSTVSVGKLIVAVVREKFPPTPRKH